MAKKMARGLSQLGRMNADQIRRPSVVSASSASHLSFRISAAPHRMRNAKFDD